MKQLNQTEYRQLIMQTQTKVHRALAELSDARWFLQCHKGDRYYPNNLGDLADIIQKAFIITDKALDYIRFSMASALCDKATDKITLYMRKGNEPKCPNCKNENAMCRYSVWFNGFILRAKDTEKPNTYICRDCGIIVENATIVTVD
jgi:hypothetical protein